MKPTQTATGVVIEKESWRLLMQEPLYSLRFIDRNGTDELAAVARVEELDWFVGAPRPLSLGLAVWRAPDHAFPARQAQPVWVVAVGYQLHPSFGADAAGVFYLDPRHPAHAALLHKLVRQDALTIIFLNADTSLHYTAAVPLASQQLADWTAKLKQAALPESPADATDPAAEQAFRAALAAFQQRYDIADILSGHVGAPE